MDEDKVNYKEVLDKGFVRLVDSLGSDARIVQAARVSYGEGTKTVREDKALIDYLMRNEHTSPFEQVVFTFHVKAPIFVARQWFRTRTGSYNEISGRYSIMKNEWFVPKTLNKQAKDNKQGRAEALDEASIASGISFLDNSARNAFTGYKNLLDLGVSREQARVNLPLSSYTEWYWTINLHNLFRFLKQRLDKHAQAEIREYAEAILPMVEELCPCAVESFKEHVLYGVRLSRSELEPVLNTVGLPSHIRKKICDLLQG